MGDIVPPDKRTTGVHAVVPDHVCYQRDTLVAALSDLRKDFGERFDLITAAIHAHLLDCERKHGPLGPVLENLIRQVTSNGRLHDSMEARLRVVEDRDTAESAQRLHDRVRELEAAKVEADKKIIALAAETAAELAKRDQVQAARESAAAAERKLWGRIIPAAAGLLAGGGGALAGNFIERLF